MEINHQRPYVYFKGWQTGLASLSPVLIGKNPIDRLLGDYQPQSQGRTFVYRQYRK